jgi:hypothetical protein
MINGKVHKESGDGYKPTSWMFMTFWLEQVGRRARMHQQGFDGPAQFVGN